MFFFRTSFNGTVFQDANNDGVRQGGEAGIPGATVSLYDSASNLIATVTSGPTGVYQLRGQYGPGSYSLTTSPPPPPSGGTPPPKTLSTAITRGGNVVVQFPFPPPPSHRVLRTH